MELSNWKVYSLLAVAIALTYHNSLDCGFVFDDASAIKDNKDLRPETPLINLFFNDFWGTPMYKEKSHKSYRPLCVLTFRLNYMLSELNPRSYHLVNVILHVIVSAMFFRLSTMFVSRSASLIAAMLFALHPIHTEAVTGVVGRAELLSSIFYIGALLTYSQCTGYRAKTDWSKLVSTVVLVGIAMLCKEQGITIIGVCCVYEVFVAQKMTLRSLLDILLSIVRGKPDFPGWLRDAVVRAGLLSVSTVLLLAARVNVMGAQLPVFTRFDNPAAVAPAPHRQLTYSYLIPVNLWLLLYPSQLCCDWTMGTIPLVTSLFDPRNLATVAAFLGLLKLGLYAIMTEGRRAQAVIISLSLLVFPFIPASNLFFPVGFVVAERILYAPSMGFCLLVGLGWDRLMQHRSSAAFAPSRLLWMALLGLLVSHGFKTYIRNFDWESEYTIFQAALRVNQNNAKLFNNVGHALENEKDYQAALHYFSKAVEVQPDDIGAHMNVGRALNHLTRYAEAERSYRKALDLFPPVIPGQRYTTRIAPNHLNVFVHLGNLISKNSSRLQEADALYRTAISMRSDYTQAYINRGDILLKLNRVTEAREQYETALRYDSDNPDLYYNLGVVQLEQKQQLLALRNFERALTYDPDHTQSLFNSVFLIQELGDPKLRPTAYARLFRLMEREPNNEKIYFNLGMLAMDDNEFLKAEEWFKKAIQLKDDFRSALFNLALMMVNDLHRPLDAVPYLNTLLKHYPHHSKGLILLGDININHVKDLHAAEENFAAILRFDPHNVQASHNLCVVFVERGELTRAEKCLEKAATLAPEEDYIQKHLQIVRGRIAKARQTIAQQQKQQQQQQQQQQANKSPPPPA